MGTTLETKQNPVLVTSAHLAWFKAIDFGGLEINELRGKNFESPFKVASNKQTNLTFIKCRLHYVCETLYVLYGACNVSEWVPVNKTSQGMELSK